MEQHKVRIILVGAFVVVALVAGSALWWSGGTEAVAAAADTAASNNAGSDAVASDTEEWPNALESTNSPSPTSTSNPAPTTTLPPTTTTIPVFDGSTAYVAKALVEEGFVEVWDAPDHAAGAAWSLVVPTEFFGPRYFELIGEEGEWYQVAVPVRPNGTTGWIPKSAVSVSTVDSRIEIDLSDRTMSVERDGVVVSTVSVAIGKDGSPTPTGHFYLRDELPWDETSVYGPFVLALSAYSETIDQINGGDAVVAIHGTRRPDLLGQKASLGCIRVENETIVAVAEIIEPGTPVDIVD